uniref:Uncharacterized protein n=1 Tax=Avena sativa TaxID=4498 RepID=A0ACD5VLE2_AVESA
MFYIFNHFIGLLIANGIVKAQNTDRRGIRSGYRSIDRELRKRPQPFALLVVFASAAAAMACNWPATPLEDDDLLEEILLRLPLQHSALPRASAVCKRWLRLITDPKFTARFRSHHRKPPLLGVFHPSRQGLAFTPVIDPPDRIPALQFDLRRYADYQVLDCRHGRVLALHPRPTKLTVCDPITGKERRVAIPRGFREWEGLQGSVLCADRAHGHLHGGCHSSPFKVALMTTYASAEYRRPTARVYSSKTRAWGNIITTAAPCEFIDVGIPGTLVGNALYWLQLATGRDILVLDLDENSLAAIPAPPITDDRGHTQIIQAEDGAAGFAILSYPLLRMWQRNADSHGVATWALWKTVDMNTILGIPRTGGVKFLHGYCEDTVQFLCLWTKAMYTCFNLNRWNPRDFTKRIFLNSYHPLTSFYKPSDCCRKKSIKR